MSFKSRSSLSLFKNTNNNLKLVKIKEKKNNYKLPIIPAKPKVNPLEKTLSITRLRNFHTIKGSDY
jgi:hypothetical protein